MKRSCGDDYVDRILELTEQLHAVTDAVNLPCKGFDIRTGGDIVLILTNSEENKEVISDIIVALEKHKDRLLEKILALGRGKQMEQEDRHKINGEGNKNENISDTKQHTD
jgi:hypothetical protein